MSLIAGLVAMMALATQGGEQAEVTKIALVVGPHNHPPGSHEPLAGAKLVAWCLNNSSNVKSVQAEVFQGWPEKSALEGVKSVVFIGDLFPPSVFDDSGKAMRELGELMDKGVGIVCLHYATGVTGDKVGKDGDHPLLHWMGGYFANPGSEHHQSVARIFPEAKIEVGDPGHPVNRGWSAFTLEDEPYMNNFFGSGALKPRGKTFVFATSQLPPEDPKTETVAWGVERPDGGRGMGIVMPHFYRNWGVVDLRRLILNGIVWTSKRDVPTGGVQGEAPELDRFLDER